MHILRTILSIPCAYRPARSPRILRVLFVGVLFAGIASAVTRTPANEIPSPALEAQLRLIKARTAERIASDRPRLDALSRDARLIAPPVIWSVEGTRSEFKECAECPSMVIMPAGEFTMGAPATELGAEMQHRVIIAAPFAVSKFEITFAEWDACVDSGGCGGYRPDDEGWGRGNHPVVNISWQDGQKYASWLSAKTGKVYRLLSEAEWEYSARAGTTTPYAVGDGISPKQANFNGTTDGAGPSDENRQRTVPVGTFEANGFGLHDMHGNVSEWVQDCWHDDYTNATPSDGAPWLADANCNGRVVRGGSWEDSGMELRSASRTGGDHNDRFYTDGLRIGRSL